MITLATVTLVSSLVGILAATRPTTIRVMGQPIPSPRIVGNHWTASDDRF